MSIQALSYEISSALQEELHIYTADDFHYKKIFENIYDFQSLHNVLLMQPAHFAELLGYFRPIETNEHSKKVLDIGVGVGLTSLYLASIGYEVTSVEPSLDCCKILEETAARLNLSLHIINATAEVIDQLHDKFDIVMFHSSLHHCDDPDLALQNARSCLKEQGELLLLSEPILRCFRTKKWFYRMLKEHPEKVGHYGGNEHIYTYREYCNFLRKANCKKIIFVPSPIYSKPMVRNIGQNAILYSIKKIHYLCLNNLVFQKNIMAKSLTGMLARLSLISGTFKGLL